MRSFRAFSCGILVTCLAVVPAAAAVASVSSRVPEGESAQKAEPRKKTKRAAAPALASGVERVPEAVDAYYGGRRVDTVTEHRNPLGATVFAVRASHFDVSPPLLDLATSAAFHPPPPEEKERSENPLLPPWRQIRSDLPDPVVRGVPAPPGSGERGEVPLAQVINGFNFLGVGISGGSPSDSNGSVGNDQFVETVNTRYQVWSLNRATNIATSILGPVSNNTLWSGFGGACQTQNSGDPIVLFDKLANRWLISQFTSSAESGVYYQCVAISTSANAAGTYYRYAFAVPNGAFGDYPHYGVWRDAYYVMAHAFASTSGGYIAAIFAAMDRAKMLAGDPSATWQAIFDATEGGHMPADLDGFAPPPIGAPGVFLSIHGASMYVYRMKVDFGAPANTVHQLQASIPIAPATGACAQSGGACIPQPGTTTKVSSLGDRLMFRAAYRNFVDHESIVVSHSVDPSLPGLVSGVRWYDFRLSGSPDAVCASYPCLRQQGTIAAALGGRDRWMPSIAMDGAENILVGYSVTGKTAGFDNHSIRYTGRAKADPLGTMTVPETSIAIGTANNTNTRWGDYSSMSVDPADDCTFWYVSQYYTSAGLWSTRVASAAFPAGTGAGQCAPATCPVRPFAAPVLGSVTVTDLNQLTVAWTGIAPIPGSYAIERAEGACGSEGTYRPVGAVDGTASSFTDTSVQGGLTYSYRVIAAADTEGRCQAFVVSGCGSAQATGTCSLAPVFAGATGAVSAGQTTCAAEVSWTPATSSCPLTPNVRYSVFRGATPDFVPSASNRIATCVPGPSSYADAGDLVSGTTYYYVVRAEDDSTGHDGACGGGNEDGNVVVLPGTPYGPGVQASPGTWRDGGGDGTAFLQLNAAGPGNTPDRPWRVVKTADDPGANHTAGGAFAYRNAGPTATTTYAANVCAEMRSPVLTAGGSGVNLKYWERRQIEYHWDGVAVEYSVNGGPWNDAPAPSNAAVDGCDAEDAVAGWEDLGCTGANPANACGYAATKRAFNGPLGGGTTCDTFSTGALTAYAHRCHRIPAVTDGDTVQFRWRFASDPAAEFAGFYLDDVEVTNVRVPNACTTDPCGGAPDGTPCDDGDACTQFDSCASGLCGGVPTPPPATVEGLRVDGRAPTTVSWTAAGESVVYDVVSSTLSDLQINGPSGATCLADDLVTASHADGRSDPPPGDGYYYLVRAQNACGSGPFGPCP